MQESYWYTKDDKRQTSRPKREKTAKHRITIKTPLTLHLESASRSNDSKKREKT